VSLDALVHPLDRRHGEPARKPGRPRGRPPKVRRRSTGRITARHLAAARRGFFLLCLLESAPPDVLDAWRAILGTLERRQAKRSKT
jgi:hypothetical protein